jgi:two-component system, OmpR family, sensor kinase
MFRSIQWTLQLWHAGLLALVLIGFGTASYFGISKARYEQLDSELERSVQVLAAGFRPPKLPAGFVGREREFLASRPWEEGRGELRLSGHEAEGHTPESAPAVAEWMHDFWPAPPVPTFEMPASLSERFTQGGPDSGYYVIWDFNGKVAKASPGSSLVPYPGVLPEWPPQPPIMGPPQIRQRGEFREAYMNGPLGARVLIGTSIYPEQMELRRLAILLAAIGAGVLVVGLVGGWLVSRRAVRPICEMTAVAQEISASNLSRRIDSAEIKSELGSLAAVLNEMFARLEAAFQQQVRFTADASHELRTPLSVIHTHAQLALSKERTAEEYRKTIETCLRASSRMKDLVDSLLLLAGVDAGRLSLERQRIDLCDVVEGCIPMIATLAEKKGVAIETDVQSAELIADASRLAQVTTNLLTNAIRYNREGGRVRVSVSAEGREAVLTISDTGVGIPAESQPHVFERFYRVDKARSRAEGGSGLGLAICKSIVEAHGGKIAFRSEVGQGTTFTVRLPLAQTTTAA